MSLCCGIIFPLQTTSRVSRRHRQRYTRLADAGNGPLYSSRRTQVKCMILQCKNPAWVDLEAGTASEYCGEACRANACFGCGRHPQARHVSGSNGLFCGNNCAFETTAGPPRIIRVPENHPEFYSVATQFQRQWEHGTRKETIKHVYFVVSGAGPVLKYYSRIVEIRKANPNSAAETRAWHGTTRTCSIGDQGNTQLCRDPQCSVCGIISTSFDIAYYKKNTKWGRFGRGIYTSAVSSKAASYSVRHRLSTRPREPQCSSKSSDIHPGNSQVLYCDSPNRVQPDPGYHSVHAKPGGRGRLNYEEYVVYTNDAIKPEYLVIYE